MSDSERTKFCFIDIETIPPNTIDEFEIEKSPPKNIKDPAKIENWYLENKEPLFRKQSLDTNYAKVLTIGASFGDSEPTVFIDRNEYDEKKVMSDFEEFFFDNIENRTEINGRIIDKSYDPIFVGVNVKQFDLQIMFLKSLKYDLKHLAPFLEVSRQRYNKASIDLCSVWSGSLQGPDAFVSMNKMMSVLGIKDTVDALEFDGSQVYDAFLAGRIDEIVKYNAEDVIRTRMIFNRVKHSIGY